MNPTILPLRTIAGFEHGADGDGLFIKITWHGEIDGVVRKGEETLRFAPDQQRAYNEVLTVYLTAINTDGVMP